MPAIDYSKWDILSVSNNDESVAHNYDGDSSQSTGAMTPLAPKIDACPAEKALIDRGVAYEKNPNDGWLELRNGICVHPRDKNMVVVSDVLLREDPATYVPDAGKYDDGRVRKWGLEPPSGSDVPPGGMGGVLDIMAKLTMASHNQFVYKNFETGRGESANDKENPEEQFINVLVDRKLRHSKSEAVKSTMNYTFIIRIELVECEDDVWRRVRWVPCSLFLSNFLLAVE